MTIWSVTRMKLVQRDLKHALTRTLLDPVFLRGNVDSVFSVSIRQFLASGAVTVIDVGLFYGLIRCAGLDILLSAAISFCLASTLNYFLGSLYVFRHRAGSRAWRADRFALYVVFALVSLGLTQAIVWCLSIRLSLHPLIGKLTAVFTLFFWNQWISKRVIFNGKMTAKTPRIDGGTATDQ